jgi:hypothetical protein
MAEKICNDDNLCIDNPGLCSKGTSFIENCPVKPRKIFKTVINNLPMWVYHRKEHTHNLGKWNNCPDDWWLAFKRDKKHFQWIPWIDIGANRPCWEVKINEGNYLKYKYDETSIHRGCTAEIFCNKQKVYEFIAGNFEYSVVKVHNLINKMQEYPFNFMNPDEEIGRRIWYYGQPAIIESLLLDQGCIMIKYVGIGSGFDLSRPWETEAHEISEWHGEERIKDDIFSPNIYWFRNEDEGEQNDNDIAVINFNDGSKRKYPKGLYDLIKYEVEHDFRKKFGIERGGGNTIFFNEEKYGSKFTLKLDVYDLELQEFHKSLAEKYGETNGPTK